MVWMPVARVFGTTIFSAPFHLCRECHGWILNDTSIYIQSNDTQLYAFKGGFYKVIIRVFDVDHSFGIQFREHHPYKPEQCGTMSDFSWTE